MFKRKKGKNPDSVVTNNKAKKLSSQKEQLVFMPEEEILNEENKFDRVLNNRVSSDENNRATAKESERISFK